MLKLDYEPYKPRKPSRFQIQATAVIVFGLIVLAVKLAGVWAGWY